MPTGRLLVHRPPRGKAPVKPSKMVEPMPHFHIISLFPSFFDSALSTGLMERALEKGILSVDVTDPRNFTSDRHRHVDDRPYGGGPGMVLQADPVARALRSLARPGRMLCMAPSGRAASQSLMRELALEEDITILCGRYEGFDGRLFDLFPLEEISVGDIVLNGGETAALAVIEAVSRLVPGFMGKEESGDEESFSESLLEYPQFTRPPVYEGLAVPDVLVGGNHAEIASWHRKRSLERTLERRPDLLSAAGLDGEDADHLAGFCAATRRVSCARNIHLCLVESQCRSRWREGAKPVQARGHGALYGRLETGDVASLEQCFGLGKSLVLESPVHGQEKPKAGATGEEMALARFARLEELALEVASLHGQEPLLVAISSWPKRERTSSFAQLRELARERPLLLVAGSAGCLDKGVVRECGAVARPVRFLAGTRALMEGKMYLSLLLDRILGDFA